METMKIKAILSAAKYKSLSRAAQDYSYTPSALSHMADSLEEELGVKLLSRSRTGVSLTDEGRLLEEKLNGVLRAEEELFSAANAIGKIRSNELRIATYSSISNYLLPPIIKAFKKVYPDVRVSITVGDGFHGWLENDATDIVFGDLNAIEENEHFIIMEERYVAVLSDGMFEGRRSVRREELYPYPFISTNESALRTYFDESRFAEILRFDSVDDTSVLSLVKEGVGVAVLPALAVQKHVKGVRAATLTPKFTRAVGFAYRNKTDVVDRFVGFMKENYIL